MEIKSKRQEKTHGGWWRTELMSGADCTNKTYSHQWKFKCKFISENIKMKNSMQYKTKSGELKREVWKKGGGDRDAGPDYKYCL